MKAVVGVIAWTAALASSSSALAHGVAPDGWHDVGTRWSSDPLVTVPLIITVSLYARGAFRLRHRLGRLLPGFGTREIGCFLTGTAVLVAALNPPLEGTAKALLSAHMVQHILLVTIAPPLLVLGKPEVAWLWSLPEGWRRGLAHQRKLRSVLSPLSPFAKPVPAATLHMAVLWIWHIPALFDAAAATEWLHWIEHVLFFGTALLFWRAVIKAAAGREAAAAALIACFITLLQSGLLSALLSFARQPLYRNPGTAAWGLTALQDQQLAGAIMSIPMCVVYLVAGLVMAARILTPPAAERAARSRLTSVEVTSRT